MFGSLNKKTFLDSEKKLIDSFIVEVLKNKKINYDGSYLNNIKYKFSNEFIKQKYSYLKNRFEITFMKIHINKFNDFFKYLDLVNGYIGHTKKEIESTKELNGIEVIIRKNTKVIDNFQFPIFYVGKLIEPSIKQKIKKIIFKRIANKIKSL